MDRRRATDGLWHAAYRFGYRATRGAPRGAPRGEGATTRGRRGAGGAAAASQSGTRDAVDAPCSSRTIPRGSFLPPFNRKIDPFYSMSRRFCGKFVRNCPYQNVDACFIYLASILSPLIHSGFRILTSFFSYSTVICNFLVF